MKITIEYEDKDEAERALLSDYALDEIWDLKEKIRSHFKYGEPKEMTLDEVYSELSKIQSRYFLE